MSRRFVFYNRLAAATVLLSYLWCILLGGFTHKLLHHLDEKNHQHSLTCVESIFNEIPSDESMPMDSKNLSPGDCSFKLSLHSFTSRAVQKGHEFVLGLPFLFEKPELLKTIVIFSDLPFLSATSSRGPPPTAALI